MQRGNRYSHLPLYKITYSFSKEAYKIKSKMPKNLKHDLGSLFFSSSIRSLKLIAFAKRSRKKIKVIQELIMEIEGIWIYMRILYDLKGITRGEYKVLSERMDEINKQVELWFKSENKN